MDDEILSAVPVLAGDPPKDLTQAARTVKSQLAKYWDRDYVNQHIQSVNNHQHKMLLQFLWMSGVRITEAVSLKKQDLDFQNYTMNVLWQKSRKYRRRIVPLHPRLRELLQL